jgi:hypothetical protein
MLGFTSIAGSPLATATFTPDPFPPPSGGVAFDYRWFCIRRTGRRG